MWGLILKYNLLSLAHNSWDTHLHCSFIVPQMKCTVCNPHISLFISFSTGSAELYKHNYQSITKSVSDNIMFQVCTMLHQNWHTQILRVQSSKHYFNRV